MAGLQLALFLAQLGVLLLGAFLASRSFRRTGERFYLWLTLGFSLPSLGLLVATMVSPALGPMLTVTGWTLLAVGEARSRRYLHARGALVVFSKLAIVCLFLIYSPLYVPLLGILVIRALQSPTGRALSESATADLVNLMTITSMLVYLLALAGFLFVHYQRQRLQPASTSLPSGDA